MTSTEDLKLNHKEIQESLASGFLIVLVITLGFLLYHKFKSISQNELNSRNPIPTIENNQ